MEQLSQRYERAKALREAELGDELVALDPEDGNCLGFNSVAASVWTLLAQPKTFDLLRDDVMEKYEVDAATCERDLRDLLADLEARGLVRKCA